MSLVSSCVWFLAAAAIIGVGASVVRSARPRSGYLMIAAGLLELASTCCVGFVESEAFLRLAPGETVRMAFWASRLAALAVHLTFGVLLAVSIAGLAKAARQAEG